MWQIAKIDGPEGPRSKEASMTNRYISPLELKLGGAIVVSNFESIKSTVNGLVSEQERDFAYDFLASALPRYSRDSDLLTLCLLRSAESSLKKGDLAKAERQLIEAERRGACADGQRGRLEKHKGNLELARSFFSKAVQHGEDDFVADLNEVEQIIWQRSMRPAPRLIRTPRDAEIVARDWLKFFGFHDAIVTPPGPDGGIDIVSRNIVAQVKMEGKPTGSPVIQALAGVAKTKQRQGAVFSLAGFTSSAMSFAADAEIALFSFNFQGEPEAKNQFARRLRK
jgi:hypothetical protein